ncbi:MAG: hypothetical protein ACJAYC_001180 [Halieaceae bacterium]|jgi:hypothetical protein
MLGKILLWISAVTFISYGLVCFFAPGVPAGYAGLTMTNGDAFAEIVAMYGGLQTGFGIFCLLAALRSEYFRAGLMLLALCIGMLALGRLYSFATGGNPVGAYTYGAFAYEMTTAILAIVAIKLSARVQPE